MQEFPQGVPATSPIVYEKYSMHIDIRHLRAIIAIHQSKSLAQAADQLHITQSALSHQIKNMRDQLGVELFVKGVKPLRLSVEGYRFLRSAEKILPEIDALKMELIDVLTLEEYLIKK